MSTPHRASCHGAAGELQCEPWEHKEQPAIPRRAAFDDLRVGQWVAWLEPEVEPDSEGKGRNARVLAGRVADRGVHDARVKMRPQTRPADMDSFILSRGACERGEVTILRDAPAAPVTVRREDYDALVDLLARIRAARAANPATEAVETEVALASLIDNADTGDTP